MPTLAAILVILGSLVAFVDFLVGDPGNRRLKDGLAEFYVAAETGDWRALYRYPARALLAFMQYIFGIRKLSVRYLLATITVSVSFTIIFFIISITWSYIHALLNETTCQVPGIGQFMQIPLYMGHFLVQIILINIVFDYVSWSLVQTALRTLSRAAGWRALFVVCSMVTIGAAILFIMYTIYLPLSIADYFYQLGAPLSFGSHLKILVSNIHQNLSLFGVPRHIFVIDCGSRPYSIFSITFIGTMQILALETTIPIILLVIGTVFGIFLYLMKPIIQRPLTFVVQRLDSSPSHLVLVVGGFVTGVIALIVALIS